MRLRLLPLLLLLPVSAWAETTLRPADSARLDNFDAAFGDAMMQGLAGGEAGDVAALTRALSGQPQVAFSADLQGEWSCRTIKLGGISPLVAYSPFKCRFTASDRGFTFEKLTGSQLTRGEITLRAGRAIYAGVGYVRGETPPRLCRPARRFHLWRQGAKRRGGLSAGQPHTGAAVVSITGD